MMNFNLKICAFTFLLSLGSKNIEVHKFIIQKGLRFTEKAFAKPPHFAINIALEHLIRIL